MKSDDQEIDTAQTQKNLGWQKSFTDNILNNYSLIVTQAQGD